MPDREGERRADPEKNVARLMQLADHYDDAPGWAEVRGIARALREGLLGAALTPEEAGILLALVKAWGKSVAAGLATSPDPVADLDDTEATVDQIQTLRSKLRSLSGRQGAGT